MKVTVRSEDWGDGRTCLTILVDGMQAFSVHDGEAEDNSLGRNFADCYSVPALMELAFKAGERAEKFEVEKLQVEVKDDD